MFKWIKTNSTCQFLMCLIGDLLQNIAINGVAKFRFFFFLWCKGMCQKRHVSDVVTLKLENYNMKYGIRTSARLIGETSTDFPNVNKWTDPVTM